MKNAESYPRVDFVLRAIADWITRYRNSRATDSVLSQCNADEVAKMARDLGVSNAELLALSTKSPESSALLEKLLVALGVEARAHAQVPVLHDLQRLCVSCGEKQRCAHELDIGSAAEHFRQYCPNAYTLDALLTEKGIERIGRRH
jgi:hypothetical protein